MNDNEHVRARGGPVEIVGAHPRNLVPCAPPGLGMFGVAGAEHMHPAGRAQARQCLNGGLGAGDRQHGVAAVTGARGLRQPVFGFRQAGPHGGRQRGHGPADGIDPGGQIKPVLARDAITRDGPGKAAAVLKHC